MGVVYPRVAKIYQGRQCRRTGPSGRQCRRTGPLAPGRRASAPRAGGGRAALRSKWGGGGKRRRTAHEQGPSVCGALGGSAAGQGRWRRVDARPPHEQGAGALCFGPNGAAVRADGGKPTSRGLPPAGPLGDAALPCGQGALPVCGGRRCLPCGQRRCRVARRIMAYRGRKRGLKAFCPSGNFPGAPGNGDVARCPTGNEDTRPPQMERALLRHPIHRIRCGVLQARLIAIAFRGEHPAHAPNTGFLRPQAPNIPPFPSPPHSQTIPRGDLRALPAPAQGSRPLRIPFWGTASAFPQPPSPKNAAGGRPLLVGLPPCMRSAAGTETKRSTQAPCSWGLGA